MRRPFAIVFDYRLRCPLALLLVVVLIASLIIIAPGSHAQDTVTGAFEGTVSNSLTGERVPGAAVEIILREKNLTINKRSDARGRFYQGLLEPGIYLIRVSAAGYQTREVIQRLFVSRTGEVVPVPVTLDPVSAAAPPPSSSAATSTTATGTTPAATPTPATAATTALTAADTDIRARTSGTDASRGGSFTEEELVSLPLGATTITRSFDQLTLLLPGVAAAPQTLGGVPGPGVGSGVGTSGQFAVNGLRSRANNFTVDGSDNNDEDIGVRRQGFFALVPQSIESIREYQVITALAPAQFGRNIGAQVNAVSKSGTNDLHGTAYGFFNASQLNSRNPFDTLAANTTTPVRAASGQQVILAPNFVFDDRTLNFAAVGGTPLTTRFNSGDEDSLTYAAGGFVLGGPVVCDRTFFFLSFERQSLNAVQEQSFAVPVIEQRGAFNTGASGIFSDPFTNQATFANPTTRDGAAIFSLYPFPNNPGGVYGRNTFTNTLPSDARGTILSGKIDDNFRFRDRQQTITGRYNFTQDFRTIPATGEALFSTLRPRVRTQNLSLFYNSELSAPDSANLLFNQVRLSYGRTRLRFDEVRDTEFQTPSSSSLNMPFLLNAPLLGNITLPNVVNNQIVANTGNILLTPLRDANGQQLSAQDQLGAVGQIKLAGFSPIGADVFNFPQRRINNTYQLADELTYRRGAHRFIFGVDTRRTELNSELPRNFRPLITFYGAPEVSADTNGRLFFTNDFVRPIDLAASGAASGFFQTISSGNDATINLRYYQLNFYAQDDFRIRPNLALSFGLRYEYNTPPRETNRQVESSFNDPAISLVPGLARFIDGRERIFDADKNNFAPRVGIVYAPSFLGRGRSATTLRAGYGLFYDQILGAVVSQSRSTFPRFVTLNLAGGIGNTLFPFLPLGLANPANNPDLVQQGSLNLRSNTLTLAQQIALINQLASANGALPSASGVEVTLPARRLETPLAHHYSFSFEHQITSDLAFSAAYVGTKGRNLLRFTTPNLGSNAVLLPFRFNVAFEGEASQLFVPNFFGIAIPPGSRIAPTGSTQLFTGGRPEPTVGGVSVFDSSARSRYDSLQLQFRGRLRRALQFQLAYTLSKTLDDVSDVFELAGASELPQNSLTPDEYASANFDARHRFAYNLVYDVPELNTANRFVRAVFGGIQIAGLGRYSTGQPFTVNTYNDVNLDGNITDRLNTTSGIEITGDRRQPLRLTTTNTTSLLAPIGQDGAIGRNTFRAGSILELDMAISKTVRFSESKSLQFRTDVFNFPNRANFGIPQRILESPGFGQATNTVTPGRRIQFAVKFSF